jgi:hypothetical protein
MISDSQQAHTTQFFLFRFKLIIKMSVLSKKKKGKEFQKENGEGWGGNTGHEESIHFISNMK